MRYYKEQLASIIPRTTATTFDTTPVIIRDLPNSIEKEATSPIM